MRSHIKTLFGFAKSEEQIASTVADSLLLYLRSLIAKEDSIADELAEYEKAKDLPEIKRELAYIPIYFALEEFIVGNKPPLVKGRFTKETLRDDVRKKHRY